MTRYTSWRPRYRKRCCTVGFPDISRFTVFFLLYFVVMFARDRVCFCVTVMSVIPSLTCIILALSIGLSWPPCQVAITCCCDVAITCSNCAVDWDFFTSAHVVKLRASLVTAIDYNDCTDVTSWRKKMQFLGW